MRKILVALVVLGAAIWNLPLFSDNQRPNPVESVGPVGPQLQNNHSFPNDGSVGSQISSASPFGRGTPPPLDMVALVNERKKRMVAGAFTTPEKYFHMDIKELTALANQLDPFACLQLGERYWSEVGALDYDAATDRSDSARNISVRYFKVAISSGAGNVIPIIAKRMYEAGDFQEAAAWNIVARHRGMRGNDSYFSSQRAFSQMTPEQIGAANQRAKELALETGFPIL